MTKKLLFLGGALLLLWSSPLHAQNKDNYPFVREKAYTKGQTHYGSYKRTSQYVEMSDGVSLAVDLLTPTLGPATQKGPVVFLFTPYGRSYFLPEGNFFLRMAFATAGMGWGPEYDLGSYYDGVQLLLENGYRVVAADMRGTGASFGYQMPLEPRLGLDGKEMVDWIAAQAWCDGNVGMMGASFLAWAQFMTAAQQPKALKCIFPEVMGFDVYSTGVRPGGIPLLRWVKGFSHILQGFNLNIQETKKGVLPTTPVLDEDQDGKLVDEWPHVDREELLKGYFIPTYQDREDGTSNLYYQALLEHLDNVEGVRLLDSSFQYYNSRGPEPFEDISYEITSPGYYARQIAQSEVAIYNAGGWYDGFAKGPPMWYASLANSNPSYLMLAPRTHFPIVPRYYKKFGNYPGKYQEELRTEQLRFFDYYLKGKDRGFSRDSSVKVFVMHEGWLTSNSWPLPGTRQKTLFLGANQSLAEKQSKKGKLKYRIDFTHSSNYGSNDANRWLMFRPGPGEVMNRKTIDDKCLLFEGNILEKDLLVVGHPMVKLFLSSDQAFGDVFVYLEEVDPKGNAFYVSEGQLRAGWARSYDYDQVAANNWDVKPDFIPWKGYREEQWVDSIFAKQEIVELSFDLLPVGYKFRKGNKIRLSLAGADVGNFELHPGLCASESDPESCRPTTYSFIFTDAYPSQLELPVVSKQQENP